MQDLPIVKRSFTASAPYFIYAPPYTRFSAGIKALYILCHSLNEKGETAYILPLPNDGVFDQNDFCAPNLITPILTQQLALDHLANDSAPIILYPEIVTGNPLKAPCIVRYVLNFPSALGGDRFFNNNELCFGYSQILAAETAHPDNILFIPTSDIRIFYPPATQIERRGTCFYASKYQKTHHGKLLNITKNSLEITSGLANSQSPEEIAEIFRTSEVFYTYENTALAIEATLCGCPAVFIPNMHLQSIIASEELGNDGFAWGISTEEMTRAKATVHNAYKNYTSTINKYYEELNTFIAKTQKHAQKSTFKQQDFRPLLDFLHKIDELEKKNIYYASFLKKLPWQVEKQIGALLNTIGLKKDGEFLWDRATRRSKIKSNIPK